MTPIFTDPYTGASKKVRLQTYIDSRDHELIMSIRPNKGTIQVVNNTLWERFCRAVEKAGIKELKDKIKFEEFVANLEITQRKGKSK